MRFFRFFVFLFCLPVANAADDQTEIRLPRAMAWSAYNLGSTGYNQAVAISKMLKNRHRVSLRVVPGKNDVSRMLPLMVNRVQFAANGVATYFAQEGVFQFASDRWGPVPVRIVMMSVGLSNQGLAVAEQSGITEIASLAGKRVPWVRGAPALNISTQAQLACGGLTWDDVERVDYPGYGAMWNGIVDGQIDVAFATTVSGSTRKLEASPRGISWLTVPHGDEQCWQNMLAVAPYYTQHIATRGTAISETEPHEGATYPYPVLITLAKQSDELVFNLTRAMHEGFDDYRNADPGSLGWDINRQQFEWVVPFHKGAIRYFKQIGVWTDEHELHNARLLERQQVLASAWQAMESLEITDKQEFQTTWMKLRALRLEAAGFNPVWTE
jgi:TRAP transporter TAXI family solute receptor